MTGFLFFLPFGRPLAGPIILADFFLAWGIAAMLLGVLRRGGFRLSALDGMFLVFLGCCGAGRDTLFYPGLFGRELATLLFLYLGMRALTREFRGPADVGEGIRTMSRLLSVGAAWFVICAGAYLAGFIPSVAPGGGKLAWPFAFPNQLAIYLVGAFPLAWGAFPRSLPWRLGFSTAFLGAIAFVGSRIAMAVGLVECLVLEGAAGERETGLPRWFRLGAMVGLFGLAGFLVAGEWTFNRAIGAIVVEDQTRFLQLSRVGDLGESWWWGIGLGCFEGGFPEEVHNTLASLFIEAGIPGFVVLVTLWAGPFLRLARPGGSDEPGTRPWRWLLLVATGGLALTSLFHNLVRTRLVWVLWAMAMAMTRDGEWERQPAPGPAGSEASRGEADLGTRWPPAGESATWNGLATAGGPPGRRG